MACCKEIASPLSRAAVATPLTSSVISRMPVRTGLTGVTPLLLYRGWIVDTARKFGSLL